MARVDREGPIQRAIVSWLRLVLPGDCLVHHSANESHLAGFKAMKATQRKKADGMVPGFPDLVVLTYDPIRPVFFEVKAEGNYATPAQKEVHAKLSRLGYHVAVVRSIEDVRECLQDWGIGFREVSREAGE